METGYRRFDIFYANLDRLNIDNHFVVIVSNWKNNIKSKDVNCVLITSKLKEHPSHVTIEGFGLKCKSNVTCENLISLKKNELLYKVGNIEDIFTQLEIEKALESQLQLSSQYINTDIELLESYLHEGVQKLNNKSKLENLKSEICNLALEGKLQECIIKCNELIYTSNSSDITKKNLCLYLWHSFYHRSLTFSKLQQHQLSLADAKESLKFCGSLRDGLNNRYAYSMWLIGKNFENLNNNIESIRIYKSLAKYYRSVGKVNMQISMLFNIARLNRSITRMITLFNIAEKINFTERETDMTKETLLKHMKEEINLLMQ